MSEYTDWVNKYLADQQAMASRGGSDQGIISIADSLAPMMQARDDLAANYAYRNPNQTMDQAMAAYNAGSRDIDPEWVSKLARAQGYFRDDATFAPGTQWANSNTLQSAIGQWERDAAPSLLDQIGPFLPLALGGAAALGLGAGGAAEAAGATQAAAPVFDAAFTPVVESTVGGGAAGAGGAAGSLIPGAIGDSAWASNGALVDSYINGLPAIGAADTGLQASTALSSLAKSLGGKGTASAIGSIIGALTGDSQKTVSGNEQRPAWLSQGLTSVNPHQYTSNRIQGDPYRYGMGPEQKLFTNELGDVYTPESFGSGYGLPITQGSPIRQYPRQEEDQMAYAQGGARANPQDSPLAFLTQQPPYIRQYARQADPQPALQQDGLWAPVSRLESASSKQQLPVGGSYSSGGFVSGTPQQYASGGQADNIRAMLSPGEYVMDADTVSALGDGNSEAGAAALDKFREKIRRHKRSASSDGIPPKAKSVEKYLKRGK